MSFYKSAVYLNLTNTNYLTKYHSICQFIEDIVKSWIFFSGYFSQGVAASFGLVQGWLEENLQN